MKEIIGNPKTQTVFIKDIIDNSLVGIVIKENKYIIVSKRHFGEIVFCRMNDLFNVLEDNKTTKRELLEKINYSEAFEFVTKKEMLNWLLK